MQDALKVKKLTEFAVVPIRGSKQAAGYDLVSAYDLKIEKHGKAIVKTDIAVAIPEGHYGRIAPRSSIAWKNHIDVGAGVIDCDYRGNVGVVLFNHSNEDFEIKRGDRVAQLILERISTPDVIEVDELDNTERGEGGFGSTEKIFTPCKQESDCDCQEEECMVCAIRDCPHKEPLHYHHDGCPACFIIYHHN